MGISNCLFHLALHNKDLVGVDPHSKDITKEQIAMIIDEISENPWYMLREIVRIPAVASVDTTMLRGNRGNISLYWLFFNHITTMLIQPRQTGKSVSADALIGSLLSALTINTDITLLTKDDALRVKNVTRLKELLASLPTYLQLRTRKDTNNTEKITVTNLGNTYITAVAQASAKAAINLGRGMTTPIVQVDEIAYINNIDVTLPAMLPATSAARDSAAESGSPYGNIFTTTPGYLSNKSGAFAYQIYNESFRWTEELFDSRDTKELRDLIKANSPSGKAQVLLEYNHRQLGYTDEWLRDKIADAMSSGKATEADFLNIWPEGSGSSVISKDKMKIIVASKLVESNMLISSYGYIIRLYVSEEYFKTRTIVAGLDTSDAVGSDGIGLVLRDVTNGIVLGTGDFNETNTITFSKWLAEFLIENPNITLIIERKSTGVSIIDAIIEILIHKHVDPFKRLFNWVVNDSRVKTSFKKEIIDTAMAYRDPDVYIRYRKYFGFATSGAGRTARDMLYGEVFNTSVRYTADSVKDPKLITQLTSLIVKNNRIDHPSGGKDDLVVGWLLAYWMLSKGENLDFYGIPAHKVLTNVTESIVAEKGGIEAIEAREYQIELKGQIDELADRIKDEKSITKAKIMLNRLKLLYRDIDTNVVQSFNINSLIDSLELDKKKIVNSVYRR